MLHMRPTGRHMPHHLRLGLLLLLPLLLAACGGGSGTVAHSTLPTATPAPPLPPTAKGVYLSVYDESNANGQTIVSNQAIVALNPADGSVRWRVPAPGNIGNLVTTDRVIYAMIGQTVVALRASDGIQMWSHPLNGDFIYANGVIYGATSDAGSDMTLVVALDGLTGATRWTSQPLLPGSLTLDGSDIIVSNVTLDSRDVPTSASLYALDAGSGKLLWKQAVKGEGISVAASHGDQLYLDRSSGSLPETQQVQAVRLSDGSQLWESGDIQDFSMALDTDSTHVYIQLSNGMQALNVTDGSVAWTYTSPTSTGPAILANGVIYLPQYMGSVGIVALDSATGKTLHSAPFNFTQVEASPVFASGLIYLHSTSADSAHTIYFVALDTTSDFTQRWQYQGALYSPVVSNGTVFTSDYAPTSDSSVYAFNATTGALLWKYSVGHLLQVSHSGFTVCVVD